MSISKDSKNLNLDTKRHSLGHLLAAAVKDMFPEAQFGVGPVIENGCYYDFILPRTLIPEDLELLEGKMREILKRNLAYKVQELSLEEALNFFADAGQPLKVELLNDLATKGTTSMDEAEREIVESEGGELKITLYRIVDEDTGEILFEDLCKGPHVTHIKELRSCGFNLDKFSASYWRGDQARDIRMQRIYALVFETRDELKKFIADREEAKKRDHRVLGEQLDIYAFSDLIGPGLPLWLPKGRRLQMLLEQWAHQEEKKQGYSPVATPLITKENLFYTSGHLPHYIDSMYSAMDIDGENYYIKPMNCPFHHQIFAARQRSYRDLPLRLSEYGFCHRYEDSGALFGLMRVRSMKMNDAHIYCTREQAVDEFVKSVELIKTYFEALNITDYWLELALRNPENDKYHDDEQMWADAERMSMEALEKANVRYVIEKDGAAFYGPKIDIQMRSSIGKVFTASTSQIDLYMPQRFGLTYTDNDGNQQTPVCIHRAPLSTHERMIGFLLEHFAGRFPIWLAPTQIKILTVNNEENTLNYIQKIKEVLDEIVLMKPLKYNELRYELDERNESLGKKIREAEMEKIPVILIAGPRDIDAGVVSVRTQEGERKVELKELKSFLETL